MVELEQRSRAKTTEEPKGRRGMVHCECARGSMFDGAPTLIVPEVQCLMNSFIHQTLCLVTVNKTEKDLGAIELRLNEMERESRNSKQVRQTDWEKL